MCQKARTSEATRLAPGAPVRAGPFSPCLRRHVSHGEPGAPITPWTEPLRMIEAFSFRCGAADLRPQSKRQQTHWSSSCIAEMARTAAQSDSRGGSISSADCRATQISRRDIGANAHCPKTKRQGLRAAARIASIGFVLVSRPETRISGLTSRRAASKTSISEMWSRWRQLSQIHLKRRLLGD